MHPAGAAQPGGEDEYIGNKRVVSEEYVAHQVMEMIKVREDWLRSQCLPMDTVLEGTQISDFLKVVKAAYHGTPEQRERQDADWWKKGRKRQEPGCGLAGPANSSVELARTRCGSSSAVAGAGTPAFSRSTRTHPLVFLSLAK